MIFEEVANCCCDDGVDLVGAMHLMLPETSPLSEQERNLDKLS